MRRAASLLGASLPWAALLLAFSPVLADLASNCLEAREDRSTLLAPVFLALALRRANAPLEPRRMAGALAIGLGVALELVGIASGTWSIARLGLPIAALGLAALRGSPPLPAMALAFWAVPLPDSLFALPSPALEVHVARFTAALVSATGADLGAVGFALKGPAGRLDLDAADAGFVLAHALSGLGWLAGLGHGPRGAACAAVIAALVSLPLQAIVLFVTGLLVAAGNVEWARVWLHHVGWLLLSACGFLLVLRRATPVRAALRGKEAHGVGGSGIAGRGTPRS